MLLFFAEFGKVIEVRINHSHTSNPSFGFVIFEDPKSVEEVLHEMVTKTFKLCKVNVKLGEVHSMLFILAILSSASDVRI